MTGVATRLEQQARTMRERHEDVEDLLSYGATIAEIIDRSGYAGWRGIHSSLRAAGRDDLLGRLKIMLADADLPSQWSDRTPRVPTCTRDLCANRLFEDDLCLFHAGERYRWCDEPDCRNPRVALGKCKHHYDSKRRSCTVE